jgi:hypothetical protein
MKVPDTLKMEYMTWRGKALVIAGLIMLLAIVFILGLWEGYKLSTHNLLACQATLEACKSIVAP